jgi:hypothetical protein
VQIAGSMRQ